ncbi:hypothetical protein [Edaphobacter albus]|uniref:hypothetical protein n=1 Tax=Edaphobacter sp. 4G125 TaxID=2763071 RepID=UPI0016469EFC|nr:hypothetical protein [Edaphobacter sp. 4G125]QNI37559.1 hypothetical protein H7846_04450 [Edaphobacter sp. 4G125]
MFRKLPAISAIALLALTLAAGVHLRGSIPAAWNMIHIPANTPLFSDTRGFTHAIDCVLDGRNPYIANPCDPWHRPYNYPSVWLLTHYLGVTSRASNFIGVLFALVALSAYILLFEARTTLSAILIFLAVISRCVLFSIERGNNDQFVFFLLVLGFFLIDRLRPELRALFTSALLVLLTVLKIYPIAAATVFLRNRRGWKYASLTVVFAVSALLLTNGQKIALMMANTPRDTNQSFGAFPFLYAVGHHTLHSFATIVATYRAVAPLTALIIGGICLFLGAAFGSKLHHYLPPLDSSKPRGAIAIACLSIFCFAFILGASYDYRLLYLTGPLAWLVEDINKGRSFRSVPAAILILALLWKPFWLSMTGEALDGLVFFMSSVWLGNALLSQQSTHEWLPSSQSLLNRERPNFRAASR